MPKFRPGLSHFVGFFGINFEDEDLEKVCLPGHNLWYMPCDDNYDLQKMVETYISDPEISDLEKMYLFISFPTGKSKRKTCKQSCIILAECTEDMVNKFKLDKVKRKEGY